MAREGLTDSQERFVQEYVVDLNGTQAAIRAGYSADTAREQASRLLTNVAIQSAIKEEKEKYAKLVQIEAYRVIRELVTLAFSDVTKFSYDRKTGAVIASPDSPADATRAIASVKRKIRYGAAGEEHEVDIRLWSKTEALKLLGQYLSLFEKGASPDATPGVLVLHGVDPALVLGLRKPEGGTDAGSGAGGKPEGGAGAV